MQKIGLTTEQANKNRMKGSNVLTQRETESFWSMLKDSFNDMWIKILIAALTLEVVFYVIGRFWPELGSDDWISALAIFLVICAVTLIGTFVSYRQEKGAKALQEEANQIFVKTYRDGKITEISINDVVMDDCVLLQAGDKIPADGILISGYVKVDQAALNGESAEAEKLPLEPGQAMPSDDDIFTKFKCFRGSVVTYGEAVMKVTAVGDNTMLGGINQSLQEKVDTPTPSEEKLERLAKLIGVFGYVGGSIAAILTLIIGFIGMETVTIGLVVNLILQSIIYGVSIVVMAVPEGLPLMNTLVQALNVGKMLKAHIFVRNTKAIETAGYLTNLFTDKTGTLTKGMLEVVNVITADGDTHRSFADLNPAVQQALKIGAGVNNDAKVNDSGKAIGSNGTDRALMNYFIEAGVLISRDDIVKAEAFDSKVKYAAVTMGDGVRYIKGAPDVLIEGCHKFINKNGEECEITKGITSTLKDQWRKQAQRAMRVIAVAKEKDGIKTFIALVSIRDDVRNDVKPCVQKMNKAGIQVTMVTGDHLETAVAIAKETGIVTSNDDVCITHTELANMSDEEVKRIIPKLKVVARAVPADKERLVELSKSMGLVVGMTGDGVNDSAALHKADVGFAMGSGTEVAKEAGDIIILNDSLVSIADAVLYGRTMSRSVKKFIHFQLTVNVSTVFTAILAPLFGWNEVFSIVQVLWINMIMDTLAAIAFGQEAPRDRYMDVKPISRDADILTGYLKGAIVIAGAFITVICIGILNNLFGVWSILGNADEMTVKTFMFSAFIMAILWNSLNARTESFNLFEHLAANKQFILVMVAVTLVQILIIQIGGEVFSTVPMNITQWLSVVGIAFLIIPIDLIRKAILKAVNK